MRPHDVELDNRTDILPNTRLKTVAVQSSA